MRDFVTYPNGEATEAKVVEFVWPVSPAHSICGDIRLSGNFKQMEPNYVFTSERKFSLHDIINHTFQMKAGDKTEVHATTRDTGLVTPPYFYPNENKYYGCHGLLVSEGNLFHVMHYTIIGDQFSCRLTGKLGTEMLSAGGPGFLKTFWFEAPRVGGRIDVTKYVDGQVFGKFSGAVNGNQVDEWTAAHWKPPGQKVVSPVKGPILAPKPEPLSESAMKKLLGLTELLPSNDLSMYYQHIQPPTKKTPAKKDQPKKEPPKPPIPIFRGTRRFRDED